MVSKFWGLEQYAATSTWNDFYDKLRNEKSSDCTQKQFAVRRISLKMEGPRRNMCLHLQGQRTSQSENENEAGGTWSGISHTELFITTFVRSHNPIVLRHILLQQLHNHICKDTQPYSSKAYSTPTAGDIRMPSSGIWWRCAVHARTDVLKEYIASIFRVKDSESPRLAAMTYLTTDGEESFLQCYL
jgi:hypothetical protein